MNRHLAVAICWSLCPAAHLGAQSAPTWRDERRAIAAAAAAGDTTGYRAAVRALQHDVGTTPRLATQLAAAAFVAHDSADGWRWLHHLLAMGIALDSTILAIVPDADAATLRNAIRRANTAARVPANASSILYHVADPDLVVEDLAWDAPRQRLLITSVREGGVRAIDRGGVMTSFIPGSATNPGGTFALAIDRQRQLLWVTTGVLRGSAGYRAGDSGSSALLRFDLLTGALRNRFVATDSGPHLLGDMTIGPDGSVYLSDALGGAVYLLAPGAQTLRPLVPAGSFASPQTPALSLDRLRLLVPDYTFGLATIDLATGAWRWMRHPDSLVLAGIDGLYREGSDLVAVQNGVEPNRILRLVMERDTVITRADVLLRGNGASDLNHATPAGSHLLFIAQSGWDRVAADGSITHGTASDAPVIRRAELGGTASHPAAHRRP